ncbi:MAG: hypothetical protein QMD21_02970 [Candidatus Thermoplasmatota archaeon]|nr:hypothetical protein [Candidatus Thermoplasmatota archaeon]
MTKKFNCDNRGSVPFALVAVLILILAVISLAYISRLNHQYTQNALKQSQVGRLSNELEVFRTDLEIKAHILAMTAISVATQIDGNDSAINYYFSEYFNEYIWSLKANNASPNRNYQLYINDWDVGIGLARKSCYDIIPSDSTQELAFHYNTTGKSKALDLTYAGKLAAVNCTPYYTVEGWVNCSVKHLTSGLELHKNLTLYKQLDAPYPFLAEKFKILDAHTKGSVSNLARIIKYILTTIAQYRVFQGYGGLSSNWPGLPAPPGGVSDILTPNDVELAVNVAVVLEFVTLYRTLDQEAINSFNITHPPALSERTLYNLIQNYVTSGIIDPADLIALYIYLDEKPVDVIAIFAQALYAIFDQYLGKYLDYLDIAENWATLKSFIKRVLGWLGIGLDSSGAITIDSGRVALPNVTYRLEINSSKAEITEICYPYCEGAWEKVGSYWQCYGSNESSILHQLVDLTCEGSSYPIYPPPTNHSLAGTVFFIKSQNVVYLKFEHKLDLNVGDAKLVIRKSSLQDWEVLKTYNSNTSGWTAESITIPEEYINSTAQLGWEFDSNDPLSVWVVRNLKVEEIFDGVEVTDKDLQATTYNVDDYHCNLVDEIYNLINNAVEFLAELYNRSKEIITNLFKALAQYIATALVTILFGGIENYPQLEIDPNDEQSIIEYMEVTLEDWVRVGIGKLKSDITSTTDWLVDNVKEFLVEVVYKLKDCIKGTIASAINGIGDWLENEIVEVANNVVEGIVDFVVGGIFWVFGQGGKYQKAKDYVKNEGATFWNALKNGITNALNAILDAVTEIFVKIFELAFNEIEEVVVRIAELFGMIINSFLTTLESFLLKVLVRLMSGCELTNTKFLLPVDYQKDRKQTQFEIWTGSYEQAVSNQTVQSERFIIDQTPNYLKLESQPVTDKLDLESASELYDALYHSPAQYKLWLELSAPKGVHYTTEAVDERPFETTWNIEVYGKLSVSARSERRVLLNDGVHNYCWKNSTLELNLSLTVTVYSGWGLQGVDYTPTNTLLGDILEFLSKIWDNIFGVVGIAIDVLAKISEYFINIISTLLNYCFWLVDAISNILQIAIEWIRGFLSEVFSWVINGALWLLERLGVTNFEFSAFGITFAIYVDPDGSKNFYSNCGIDELFSILAEISILGAQLGFRLDAVDVQGKRDIILNGKLKILGLELNLILDPLMWVYEHFVELHGKCMWNDKGLGFDLYLPELELTNTVSFSLPVTPVPIPIPPLPIQASVEIGTELTYEAPVIDHVVINEFELSSSTNEQWVELCNPTYEDILLDGWTVSPLTGERKNYKLDGISIPGAIACARSYLIINLSHGFFTDGKPSGVVLRNSVGEVIDKTPIYADNEYDDRTWQRVYDCALTWVFHPNSKGGGNPDISSPAKPCLNLKTLISSAIKDCFSETKYELSSEYKQELDYVLKFAKTFVWKFKERILEIIREVVVELVFYVDIIIEVIGTGIGGGLKLSFVMEGTAIAELLHWLCKAVASYIKYFLNPNLHQSYPLPSSELPEHLFLRLEIYGKAEAAPKVLSELLLAVNMELKISVVIQANIPAFTLFMVDLGDWKIEFGIKVAFENGISFVGVGKNRDLEIWLIKGAIYEISA